MPSVKLGFTTACLLELLLLALAWGAGIVWKKPLPALVQFELRDGLTGVVATVPALLLFWWTLRTRMRGVVDHRTFVEELIRSVFRDWSVIQLAVISVLAGLCEEALFRGVLQTGLASSLGPMTSLVVASMVFGLMHRLSWTYAGLATVIGLYLGALLQWTGNLLIPMVVHALYDFLILLYYVRGRNGLPQSRAET